MVSIDDGSKCPTCGREWPTEEMARSFHRMQLALAYEEIAGKPRSPGARYVNTTMGLDLTSIDGHFWTRTEDVDQQQKSDG